MTATMAQLLHGALWMLAGSIAACGKTAGSNINDAGASESRPCAVNSNDEGVNVTAISVGYDHVCAIVNGSACCWGNNYYGQLGDGSISDSPTPVQVQGLSSEVTSISTSSQTTCAVMHGAAYCWGRGTQVPVQVQGLNSGVQVVSVCDDHSCAMVDSAAYCWGGNTNGAVGNNSTTNTQDPVQVQGVPSGVQDVSAGSSFSCAVVNGGAYCWGEDVFGQLGNDNVSLCGYVPCSLVPLQVQGLTSSVQSISTGSNHTCAIVNGSAYCWGDNELGQLGNNSFTNSSSPVRVQGLSSGVTSISAGYSRTCAVMNGAAYCWGSPGAGSDGGPVPAQVQGLVGNVQLIATGGVSFGDTATGNNYIEESCAVVDGAAYCWGVNFANGTTSSTPVKVQFP